MDSTCHQWCIDIYPTKIILTLNFLTCTPRYNHVTRMHISGNQCLWYRHLDHHITNETSVSIQFSHAHFLLLFQVLHSALFRPVFAVDFISAQDFTWEVIKVVVCQGLKEAGGHRHRIGGWRGVNPNPHCTEEWPGWPNQQYNQGPSAEQHFAGIYHCSVARKLSQYTDLSHLTNVDFGD